MFVGESGIARILERTCQLMKEAGFSEDVRKVGGIDISLIQKFVNFWFSQSLDLHGSEVSSNAANYFPTASRAAPRRTSTTTTTSSRTACICSTS